MIVKQILDEDFVNYKKPSMFIGFPNCSWKCEKECGKKVCQNGALATSPNIEIPIDTIVDRYLNNPLTSAIVCGGLEPFDSWEDLLDLIIFIREKCTDDIVIYTGYKKEEIKEYINILSSFENIIVKFGRYIPHRKEIYDEVLGVKLSSDNQYAEKLLRRCV